MKERMYIRQKLLEPTSTDMLKKFEDGAFESEKDWWNFYKNGGKK